MMAVLDGVTGLQATIHVDGKDLEEYDDPRPDETANELRSITDTDDSGGSVPLNTNRIHMVRKYIEAKPGVKFEMHFVKSPSFKHTRGCHHIAVDCKIDSTVLALFHEPGYLRSDTWHERVNGVGCRDPNTKKHVAQAFVFGDVNIDTTNEFTADEVRRDVAKAKNLGILRFSAYKMKYTDRFQSSYDTDPFHSEDTSIAERALKGRNLTSLVKFGELQESKPQDAQPVNVFVDPQERPFAIFEFIYMTKEGLIKEGVLPEPLPIDDLDNDELRRWAREQYLKERDRSTEDALNSKIVKKEEREEPQGRPKRSSGDTALPAAKRYKENQRVDGKVEIDLTD